jgi:hypothetical protein
MCRNAKEGRFEQVDCAAGSVCGERISQKLVTSLNVAPVADFGLGIDFNGKLH